MGVRASPEQFRAILEFMEAHGDLSRPQQGALGRNRSEVLWDTLSDLLNSMGYGVQKTSIGWKKVWSDWKTKTKKKAVAIAKYGGPRMGIKLSPSEERLVRVMGLVAIVGQSGVSELGLNIAHANPSAPVMREDPAQPILTPFSDAPVSVTAGPSRRPVVLPPRGQHLFEHVSRLAARLAREFGSALVERPAFRAVLALLPLTPAQLAALTADHVAAVAADLTDDPVAGQETCDKEDFSGTRSDDSEDSCGDSESEAAEVTGAEDVVGADDDTGAEEVVGMDEVARAIVKVECVEVEYNEDMGEDEPPDGASAGASTSCASFARTSTGGAGTDRDRNGRTSTDDSLRLFNFDEDGLPRAKRLRGAEPEGAGAELKVASAESETKGAMDVKPKRTGAKSRVDADVAMSGFLSYAGSLLRALPRPARLKAQGLVLQVLMREHAAAG